ncbi:hypothetical protein DIPPA_54342 [Diplonema papillatum]|nr:hypothetical protein DIPPA_54342 [Diplonema papillatum]
MLRRLGYVSNILAARMQTGEPMERLFKQFSDKGFKEVEIRDGEYLRSSAFGNFLGQLEELSRTYSTAEWRELALLVHTDADPFLNTLLGEQQRDYLAAAKQYAQLVRLEGLTVTYAVAYPWLERSQNDPNSANRDREWVATCKKIAFMLNPAGARLRFVDPDYDGEVDTDRATEILKDLRANCNGLPVLLAVENAKIPATTTFDLCSHAGVKLTYDAANTYATSGQALNTDDEIWAKLQSNIDVVTSVHFKQMTAAGILPSLVEPGFVDLWRMLTELRSLSFSGDLLLENAPSDDPLKEAIASREHLISLVSR